MPSDCAAGDYVNFEVKDDQTGESEWMWLRVDRCDDAAEIVQEND